MSRTSSKTWKAIVARVREVGAATGLPCSICHGQRGPIDYRTAAEADRDARLTGQWWLLGAHRPLALSVDHIRPHTAGGPDSLTNSAQAHNVCNSAAGAKGHRRRRDTAPRAVVGYWTPRDGNGEPLPGRAVPGAQQGVYVFVAAPGPSPSPRHAVTGTYGIARTPSSPEKPRSPR